MERYVVVGTSFRESDGALRDVFHLPSEDPGSLRDLHRALGVDELVYVPTCNRVEFVVADTRHTPDSELLGRVFGYFARLRGVLPDPTWRRAFHVHRGDAAVRHLFRVACSLDSMVVGEAQILGQVKRAYHASHAAGIACSWLECIFEETFRCARDVRRKTSLGAGSVSMATLAVGVVTAGHRASDSAIAIIGSGEMSSKIAMFLSGRGYTNLRLVNRTPAKIRATAERHGARVMSLEAFLADPPPTDVIVTATSAPHAILDRSSLAPLLDAPRPAPRLGTARAGDPDRLLVVDLAAPRDTDPDLDDLPDVRVVTIDDLREESRSNSEKAVVAVDAAERAVAEAVVTYPAAMSRRLVDVLCVDPVAAGML